MLGEIMVTAPTEEEAMTEILSRLGVEKDAIEFRVDSESEGELLPGTKPEIVMRAWIRPEYVADKAQERVEKIVALMGFEAQVEVQIKDRIVRVNLDAGKSSSILIGRDGQNLEALQYLVNRMILRVGREAPM
ncbi:KH domain-containing protein, partial [Candidatus Sumerlaeota bacterium]|nr:KH domain-containing protein [Candidatus Sumerlaeota bacterium]